jgi:Tol biopolymer transport system component
MVFKVVLALALVVCLVLTMGGFGTLWSAGRVLRGDVLAYLDTMPNGRDIHILDVRSGIRQNVTNSASDDFSPAWSLDGRRIAFASNRSGSYRIYVTDIATGRLISLTPSVPFDNPYDSLSWWYPAWSPDGQRVIFMRGAVPGASDYPMMVYTASSHRDMQMLDYSEADAQYYLELTRHKPSYSPDGTRIAYTERVNDRWRLFTREIDQLHDSTRPLIDLDILAGVEPVWTSDGKRIAFVALHGEIPEVYMIDPDGGPVRRLTYGGGTRPVWLP